MMKTLPLRWELRPGNPPHVMYYVDNSPLGEDDSGFDKILDMIRSRKNIQLALRMQYISPLGGGDLIDSLPFRNRFNELIEELGENKITYEFF
jgi:hypothetical protein